MSRNFALVLLAAAALSGCATSDAGRDARGWFFNAEGGETKLAYGTPQSDDTPLMLSCSGATGRVTLSQTARKPGDGVTLASGGRRTTFYGEAEADPLGGGTTVTAEAAVTAPVLSAFRDSGRLSIEENGRAAELHATPAERARIQQFFGACAA